MFFRLQMLNYLLTMQELKITHEQLLRLWRACTVQTKGTIQKRELIRVLYQGTLDTQVNISQKFFPDQDSWTQFFLQTLCDPSQCDYSNFSQEEFDLFQVFFVQYNSMKGCVRYNSGSIGSKLAVLDWAFSGRDALWAMFRVCRLDQVPSLLVTLYTSLAVRFQQRASEVQQELMDRCLLHLKEAALVSRSIDLILLLFERFERGTSFPALPSQASRIMVRVAVQFEGGNRQPQILDMEETDLTTVGQLRQHVAEKLGVAFRQVLMTEEDWSFLISGVVRAVVIGYHPKNYLSQNAGTFALLFEQLKSHRNVWRLLCGLPRNSEIYENVRTLKSLFKGDFYRSLYEAEIVWELSSSRKWQQQFIALGFVKVLEAKYLELWSEARCLEKDSCLVFSRLLNLYLRTEVGEKRDQRIQAKAIEIVERICDELGQHELEAEVIMEQLELLKLFPEGVSELFERMVALERRVQQLLVEGDSVRKAVVRFLVKEEVKSEKLVGILLGPMLKWVVEENQQRSEEYFELVCETVRRKWQVVARPKLLAELVASVRALPIREKSAKVQDQVLIGLLRLTEALLDKDSRRESGVAVLEAALGALVELGGNTLERREMIKCKSAISRKAAFECILSVARDEEVMARLVRFIQPLHLGAGWRSRSVVDWSVQSKACEKSATGFAGLVNLGCSKNSSIGFKLLVCYMNSLLQQLFMIPGFREGLLQVEEQTSAKNVALEENMLYQLKCVFLGLKMTQRAFWNPKRFCHAFKDLDGNPVNIFEQMDVDEFSNLLMDRLEAATRGSSLVRRHFAGVLSSEIVCRGCPHASEIEEPFFSVPLSIKNKKSIEECLQALVTGDTLEDDNAYFCEQCQKKVAAVKRMSLKRLPRHLILVLKRFDFDFDLMAKSKVNDRCEFPMTLSLDPFSWQALRKAENRPAQGAKEFGESYFKYALHGVVVHQGQVDNGHYFSYIRDREQEDAVWYEFNDTLVSPSDEKQLIADGFGNGPEKLSRTVKSMNNTRNAYLLFYDRIEHLPEHDDDPPPPQPAELKRDASDQAAQLIAKEDAPLVPSPLATDACLSEIQSDNQQFLVQKFIFNPEYFSFAHELLLLRSTNPDLGKVLVQFFLGCAVRDSDRQYLLSNSQLIADLLSGSLQLATWFLDAFSHGQYIREFFFDCPITMVRKTMVTLISAAMKCLQQPHVKFMNAWLQALEEVGKFYAEYFDVFYKFMLIGKEHARFLTDRNFLQLLLKFYSQTTADGHRFPPSSFPLEELPEYFGCVALQAREATAHYDELLERRMEKSLLLLTSQSRAYLWRAVSYLSSMTKLEDLNISLHHLLDESETKLTLRSIAALLCSFAAQNLNRSEAIIQAVLKQVVDKEYKEYRKYLVVLKKLMLLADQFQEQRIEFGMTRLLECMSKQTMYFFETDVCQQYILRMAHKNKALFRWMGRNLDRWQWFFDNIAKQQPPNEKLLANNVNPLKCYHRLHLIYLPTPEQNAYKRLIEWKRHCFQQLARQEPMNVPSSPEVDSDDDLSSVSVAVGDIIDYYSMDQNAWLKATVEKVSPDYLTISFQGTRSVQTLTIERDSEKLARGLLLNSKVPGSGSFLLLQNPTDDPENEVVEQEIENEENENNENDTEEEIGSHRTGDSEHDQ